MNITRTTVSISDELLDAAKQRARQQDQTLGDFIDAALGHELGSADQAWSHPEIPDFRGGTGPATGIDFSSNRALQEVLDEGTPPEKRR